MSRPRGEIKELQAAIFVGLLVLLIPHAARGQWNCVGGTCSTTGNVGIGTTSPSTTNALAPPSGYTNTLDVVGPIRARAGFISFEDANPTGDPTDIAALLYNKAYIGPTVSGHMFTVRTGFPGSPTTERVRVDPDGNLGIGTGAPVGRFNVANPSCTFANTMTLGNAAGILASFTADLPWGLYLGQQISGNTWIQAGRTDSPTAYNILLQPSGGSVGIGTLIPQHKLAVNGTIGAKEVVVTNTGWADYVLEAGYAIAPLEEVSAYIQKNRRLPEMPSVAEVEANGVGIGEMQVRLLAKIEELTLHVIQEHERGDRLEQQNRELQERIAWVERRVAPGRL